MSGFAAWIGRSRDTEDRLDLTRAQALQAALDATAEPLQDGDALPPLWHWLYFWELAAGGDLGPDGHAARGEFLPPIPLPRRMWAGGKIAFHGPLRLGAPVARRSSIASVEEKQGRSGPLVFVTLRHELWHPGEQIAVSEAQDIVYRAAPAKAAPPRPGRPAPRQSDWRREVTPDPVLLFRYSALTFNSHRIHYDADYARGAEGYPGLVVHGPLMATLLLGAARQQAGGQPVETFQFRALKPAFAGQTLLLAGKGHDLWIADADGDLVLQASMGAI